MHPITTDLRRRLILWDALLVSAHYVVVVGHVALLVKVQPDFPRLAIVLLILVNLFPVAGVIAFAKGFPKLAASALIIPFGVALVIGGYTHFLSAGSDNVLRIPASELRLPFQISAVLLTLLEALACGVGFKMLVSVPCI
jgi:hypothetical protein